MYKRQHKCLLFQKYEYLYGVHRDGHYNLIDKKAFSWFCICLLYTSEFIISFNQDYINYGYYANMDFISDPEKVRWAHFIDVYKRQNIGNIYCIDSIVDIYFIQY